jgi:hypothetical protein
MPLRLPKPLTPRQQRDQARRQADAWYQAALGALPTVQRIEERGQQQQDYVTGLAAALSQQLAGGQVAVANAAGAAPGVVMQAAQQAAGPANNAIAATGTAPQQNVGAAEGRFAALIGANAANALAGLAPAATARGNIAAGQARAATTQRLDDRGRLAAEAAMQREDRYQSALQAMIERDLAERSAVDQSNIAWATLNYDQQNELTEARLRELGMTLDARTDAARLAQQQAQHEDRMSIDRARIEREWAELERRINADRQRAAAAGKPANAKKERQQIINQAKSLAASLRKETTKTPGRPGSTSERVTGMKHRVVLRWKERNTLGQLEDRSREIEVTGKNWNDVAAQVQRAYGNLEGFSFSPLGEPTPVTTTDRTPGTNASTRPRWSTRQVYDHVFGFLRAAGWPTAEAKRVAASLVPGGAPKASQQPARSPGRTTGRRGVA